MRTWPSSDTLIGQWRCVHMKMIDQSTPGGPETKGLDNIDKFPFIRATKTVDRNFVLKQTIHSFHHKRLTNYEYNKVDVTIIIAPCKIIRFPESRKYLFVESGILFFGIRNPALLESRIWNPALLESWIWNPAHLEFIIWNQAPFESESKTVMGCHTWGNTISLGRERKGILHCPTILISNKTFH